MLGNVSVSEEADTIDFTGTNVEILVWKWLG